MASKQNTDAPQPCGLDETINRLTEQSIDTGRPLSAADMAFLRRNAPAAYEAMVWWQAQQQEVWDEKMAKEYVAEQKKKEWREQMKDWEAKIAERYGLKEGWEKEMMEVMEKEYEEECEK